MDPPIGRQLHYVARRAEQTFNAVLANAGGTLPMWLILLAISRHGSQIQSALAKEVGIQDATLTHHLDGLERDGLVTRSRCATDRRAIEVGVTEVGKEKFEALHVAAIDYERRLTKGATEEQLSGFQQVLQLFAANLIAEFDQ